MTKTIEVETNDRITADRLVEFIKLEANKMPREARQVLAIKLFGLFKSDIDALKKEK